MANKVNQIQGFLFMHAFKWDLEHDMHIYETRTERSPSADRKT